MPIWHSEIGTVPHSAKQFRGVLQVNIEEQRDDEWMRFSTAAPSTSTTEILPSLLGVFGFTRRQVMGLQLMTTEKLERAGGKFP